MMWNDEEARAMTVLHLEIVVVSLALGMTVVVS
jgi:hypothetical protein